MRVILYFDLHCSLLHKLDEGAFTPSHAANKLTLVVYRKIMLKSVNIVAYQALLNFWTYWEQLFCTYINIFKFVIFAIIILINLQYEYKQTMEIVVKLI